MAIDRDLGLLFIHVPKTGGTAIETALGLRGDWQVEDRSTLFGQISSPDLLALELGSGFLTHLTLAEARQVLGGIGPLTSFSVVRNPWDRLVSTYHRIDKHMLWQARDDGIELSGLSFAEFVPRLLGVVHAHTVPQARYVTVDGRIAVDRLGRYETLAADFASIAAEFGIVATLPSVNLGTPRAYSDYRAYYDDTLRRMVERFYEEDCDLFGYVFDPGTSSG